MKKTNFHTHTYRCGHANGSEEDMICAAMKMGIEELGLSEHVPLPHYRQHLFKSLVAIRSPRSFLSLIYAFIKPPKEIEKKAFRANGMPRCAYPLKYYLQEAGTKGLSSKYLRLNSTLFSGA